MKKSRFTEEQIYFDFARAGGGRGDGGGLPPPWDQRADVLSLESQIWRHDAVRRPEADQKLKGMEDENRRLKKLLAEAMLDVSALKDILGKN
jgi:putative transposase